MDSKEMVRCARQIEKLQVERSYESILVLLADLHKAAVTAEQLETTDVVQVLYRVLKSCSDQSVKRSLRGLLAKWKREYSKEAGGEKEEVEEVEEVPSSSAEPDLVSSDSVRTKCVQLLLAALHPEPPDEAKAAELAGAIEQQLHRLHPHNPVKYKTCVRSKVANLRNPKSGHLRRGLLAGSLSAEAFARMSAEEMAGAELRQLREEYSSRGVSERQLPRPEEGTPTQKIRCKRCGGTECRVTQVTRGALFLPSWVRRGGPGEDAMTFVTCSRCGQQWYHSGWICL